MTENITSKMDFSYQITDLTLNYISQFYFQLSAFCHSGISEYWIERLFKQSSRKQAMAAVSIGRNLTENSVQEDRFEEVIAQLDEQSQNEYRLYLEVVNTLWENRFEPVEISVSKIDDWHSKLIGRDKNELHYREGKGVITKGVWQNGIKKIIDLEVSTSPAEISEKMEELVAWYQRNVDLVNPVILAALLHYKIAEIHPYEDGNGRLSRLLGKLVMLGRGYGEFLLIPTEYYYYNNRFQYFELIEETNSSGNLNKWIEFYASGWLSSVRVAMNDLAKLSGGSVDLELKRIISLTRREQNLVDLLSKGDANAAELGKRLKVSRQNVNVILKRLVKKGLVEMLGRGTASRYSLIKVMG